MKHSEWDWADQEYVQWYICNHTKMFFQHQNHFDPVGYPMYTEYTKFNFKCSLTGFANDKIRAFYKIIDAPGATKAEFINDSKNNQGTRFLTPE